MPALEPIQQHLRTLCMPTATRETWPFATFLSELLEQEIEGRSQRRVERLQKSSRLSAGKKPWQLSTRKNCPCTSPASWLNCAVANL
jgi:hypothetical protein